MKMPSRVELAGNKPSKKRPEDSEVTILISGEALKTLVILLNNVGGDPKASRRKHTEQIRKAIESAGVETSPIFPPDSDSSGSIHFKFDTTL